MGIAPLCFASHLPVPGSSLEWDCQLCLVLFSALLSRPPSHWLEGPVLTLLFGTEEVFVLQAAVSDCNSSDP